MARKGLLVGIIILGAILISGLTLWGVKYDFILVPNGEETPTLPTTTPGTPTYDTVKPSITFVQADGEALSKESYLLIDDSDVTLIEFGVLDYFLIDRTNPINSEVRLSIFKKSDAEGTISQLYSGTWSGDELISQCFGVLNMNFYMNARFSQEINIVPGYEYQVEISATDAYFNTITDGRWKIRAFLAPGELEIAYWIPRENRWIDFEVLLENDETVKSLSAFFKNNAGDTMKKDGETYYVDLALDFDRWEFTWDTENFPDDYYAIHFLCEYGDTGLELEEPKYEKEYLGGLTFQIFNTNTDSIITAPGFGVVVGLIAISVIVIIIKMRIGDDNKNVIRKKTKP